MRAGDVFRAFFAIKPHGTGVGLAITRSIVEAHGVASVVAQLDRDETSVVV